jgi:NAD(P)-dependent dehydrogenase (short-subunit alcohol dehydrogenase family)
MSNILVTGGGNGLGAALVKILGAQGHNAFSFDTDEGDDVVHPDLTDILGWDYLNGKIDILINCAGVNIINWLEDFTEENWDKVMNVNAKGIYMMTRACLPMLIESKGTVVNVVSNAAHMPMTCSLAYNASKGAAHIMTLQLARELTRRHGITVFGIAPNKLHGTGMSDDIDRQVVETRGWTKEYAQEYQLKGLLTGEETPPEAVAEFLAFLLQDKEHHKYLTGTVIPYGI